MSDGSSAKDTFGGKGTTESKQRLQRHDHGAGHRRAAQRPPDGAGEKQIGVNANVDVLRFSGQVDPARHPPGNSVPSTQIANVRVEHRSRGQQADAQVIGLHVALLPVVMPI